MENYGSFYGAVIVFEKLRCSVPSTVKGNAGVFKFLGFRDGLV